MIETVPVLLPAAGWTIDSTLPHRNTFEKTYWQMQGEGEAVFLNQETGLYEIYGRNYKTKDIAFDKPTLKAFSDKYETSSGIEYLKSYAVKKQFKNWKALWAELSLPPCLIEHEKPLIWFTEGSI